MLIFMFVDEVLIQSNLFGFWFGWLVFINSASMFFIATHNEARWILVTWLVYVGSLVFYDNFLDQISYTRFAGLSQIVLWTPLLFYLILRIKNISLSSISGKYIATLFLSNFIALMLDYRAFILWLLGERAAQL